MRAEKWCTPSRTPSGGNFSPCLRRYVLFSLLSTVQRRLEEARKLGVQRAYTCCTPSFRYFLSIHPGIDEKGEIMTDLLYQTDSYLQEFDATVTSVDAEAQAVVLDRTVFYPGGGGQPYDTGQLTDRRYRLSC
jgi:hypothetical protein